MADDQDVVGLLPGEDSRDHSKLFQSRVADALTDLYGEKVTHQEVSPIEQTDPIQHDDSDLVEKPGADLDFADFADTIKGSHKEAPAKGFLHALVGKLRKKTQE